jgi:large subunit ribosomal protein L32
VAVPKKKKSRMRRDRRRANHDKVTVRAMAICPSCGAPMVPHRACASCGTYKGRQVIDVDKEGGSGAES